MNYYINIGYLIIGDFFCYLVIKEIVKYIYKNKIWVKYVEYKGNKKKFWRLYIGYRWIYLVWCYVCLDFEILLKGIFF